MDNRAAELAERAKVRFAIIERRRRTPRYRRVLGRFVGAGLLSTNEQVIPHRAAIELADALWAGEFEPRIFELLPALLIEKPSSFKKRAALPGDLIVCPGHDYGKTPLSTLARERGTNYTLKPRTLDEFVAFMGEP